MHNFLNHLTLAFVAIDPLTTLSAFAGITMRLSAKDRHRIALRATVIALLTLLFFWLFGQPILTLMGVNISSFRIIGGLFLICIAFEMVFEKRSLRKQMIAKQTLADSHLYALAAFPIAVPLIAGPAAITFVILIPEESSGDFLNQFYTFLPVVIILGFVLLLMWFSSQFVKYLGPYSTIVLQRIFGLLLGALAVEFVISGIRETIPLLLA